MDPLDAPLPGVMQQTTENQPWLEELEESFFTVPPASREVEPEEAEEEVDWRGHSPWPARFFVGTCVLLVAASALVLVPGDWFGPSAVRYPVDEVITDLETGPDTAVNRTAERVRRGRRTPAKKLTATRPWTLPPAVKPVPGPVPTGVARPASTEPVATTPARAEPKRVDALPAVDLANLEPGAAL